MNQSFTACGAVITTLSANLAAPLGSSTNRGFLVRSAQAAISDAPLDNAYARAYRQINGTLFNQSGVLVSNVAFTGANGDGSYSVDTVDFERNGTEVLVTDGTGAVVAIFDPVLFPGIPGSEGSTTNFSVEVVAFITLQEGTNWFGISSGADRTDAVDDDGFEVFSAINPRDFLGTLVSETERHAFDPFASDQHLETQFALVAPVSGIYPLRILYWQTGHGANLQFYSIDPLTGIRVLVNDPLDPNAVLAYTDNSHPEANAPYIAEVSPIPGSSGNAATDPIRVLIVDGKSLVNTESVALFLNGAMTPAAISNRQDRTTINFLPSPWLQTSNTAELVYQDSTAAWHTNSWSFTVDLSDSGATVVMGQWDFDDGDLQATVGQNLEYLDPTFDGPSGSAVDRTEFGSTTSLGITNINGQVAQVMRVPGGLDDRYGYTMYHGIAPNGGGTRVNQYTLIMDIMVATNGPNAAALWRVQANGASDADLFWQNSQFGQGAGGYGGTKAFTPGEWHRVVAAYNEAGDPPVVTKYVDGIFQDDWTANQGLDHPRRSLLPVAYLFADGTPANERREMWVNSIQIRQGALSKAEIEALGGPSASGIPLTAPTGVRIEILPTSGDKLKLQWPSEITGYTLESNTNLNDSGNWQPVLGVTNNSVEITVEPGRRFFRLHQL